MNEALDMEENRNHPTMIIPSGTEVTVNDRGQLSIRTPGNLVIQNSGIYSVIESTKGSVRIDPGVRVDAVTISAAESCFIAGELTAWKVKAARISLEKSAKAFIMLQESEEMTLERSARLVGNFSNDKELYSVLSRFNSQLHDLSRGLQGPKASPPALAAAFEDLPPGQGYGAASEHLAPPTPSAPAPTAAPPTPDRESDQRVFDRELARADLSPEQRDALAELRDLAIAGRHRELGLRAAAYTTRLSGLGPVLGTRLAELANG